MRSRGGQLAFGMLGFDAAFAAAETGAAALLLQLAKYFLHAVPECYSFMTVPADSLHSIGGPVMPASNMIPLPASIAYCRR